MEGLRIRHLLHAHAEQVVFLIPQEFAHRWLTNWNRPPRSVWDTVAVGLVDDCSQPRFAGGDLSFGFPANTAQIHMGRHARQ